MKSKPFPRGEHCLPVFLQFDDDPSPWQPPDEKSMERRHWPEYQAVRIIGKDNQPVTIEKQFLKDQQQQD